MPPARSRFRTVESLYVLWGVSIALTLFAVGFFLSWSEFRSLLASDRLHFALSAILALMTFALFWAYLAATFNELNLLDHFLGEKPIPRVKPKVIVIAFGLAILFGALIAVSRELILYAAILVLYNLFDFWGNWEVAKQIRSPIEKKLQTKGNDDSKAGLGIMHAFYFGYPVLPRIATIMFVNWIVVCCALSYYFTNESTFRTVGYCLLIANIAIGELVVHYWRWRTIYQL